MPRLALALLWLCGARSDGGARAAGSTDADNPAFLLPMMLDGVPVSLPHFAAWTVAESLESFFTSHMLNTDEGPPPDAKRAASALKYMPPDGPKATVKWPSKEGQRGRRGVSLAVACGGSLGRMELAGTKHILRINNGEEDYATMDVSGVAEEDLKRLAPSFIEQPKAPRPAKKPRRFADVLQDGPAATWSEAPPPMIQREKPKPAKASQARQRKRPLLEMAQLRGDFGGRKAYVSRVLCGPRDVVGQAAQPGGLLEAAGNLTQNAMPNLARSHIDALLAERGTACFVAHTIDENDLDGDSTAVCPHASRRCNS